MRTITNGSDRPTGIEVSAGSLFSYLREYGTYSLAYTTLQPGLEYFVRESVGYIAFRHWRGFTFVLGDPVCAPHGRAQLIAEFLDRYPQPLFLHITTASASELAQCGFVCNVMGSESWIDLPHFRPTWRSHRGLKESQRRFRKRGADIFELPFSRLAERNVTRAELHRISQRWMERRPGPEMKFLLRPLRFIDEPDTRVFMMQCDNRTVGFTVFDPIYERGRVIGYCPNISRWDDSGLPTGRSAALNLYAAEIFRREGRRTMALGLLPFQGDLRSPFADSRLLRLCFRLSPRFITQFDFANLSRHKSHYKGALTQVFYATRRRGLNRLRELAAVGRLIRLI